MGMTETGTVNQTFIPTSADLTDLLSDPYLADAIRLLDQEPIGEVHWTEL